MAKLTAQERKAAEYNGKLTALGQMRNALINLVMEAESDLRGTHRCIADGGDINDDAIEFLEAELVILRAEHDRMAKLAERHYAKGINRHKGGL